MTPLHLLFIGELVIVLDLRVEGIDLAPDPVGWGISVYALRRLAHRNRLLYWAMAAAFVPGLISVADWLRPLRPPTIGDGVQLAAIDGAGVLATLYDLSATAVLVLAALGLRRLAASAGRSDSARGYTHVAAASVALDGAGLVLLGTALATAARSALVLPILLVGFAGLAVAVWWLVLLWRDRQAPWALPAPAQGAAGAAGPHPDTGTGSATLSL